MNARSAFACFLGLFPLCAHAATGLYWVTPPSPLPQLPASSAALLCQDAGRMMALRGDIAPQLQAPAAWNLTPQDTLPVPSCSKGLDGSQGEASFLPQLERHLSSTYAEESVVIQCHALSPEGGRPQEHQPARCRAALWSSPRHKWVAEVTRDFPWGADSVSGWGGEMLNALLDGVRGVREQKIRERMDALFQPKGLLDEEPVKWQAGLTAEPTSSDKGPQVGLRVGSQKSGLTMGLGAAYAPRKTSQGLETLHAEVYAEQSLVALENLLWTARLGGGYAQSRQMGLTVDGLYVGASLGTGLEFQRRIRLGLEGSVRLHSTRLWDQPVADAQSWLPSHEFQPTLTLSSLF